MQNFNLAVCTDCREILLASLHLKIKDNNSNTTACGLNTQSKIILATENFNQVDCDQCIMIIKIN